MTSITLKKSAAIMTMLALTACGGGGGGTTSSSTPLGLPAVTQPTTAPIVNPNTTPVVVKAIFATPGSPGVAQSGSRQAKFVSPSTNGAKLILYPHGSGTALATYYYDLTNASGLCSGNAPRVCLFPIKAPSIQIDFDFETYDTAPVSNAFLGGTLHLGTSILTSTIVAGAANSVVFSLSGIPAVISLSTAGGPLAYASEASDGATHTLPITASVQDAAGNVITGPVPYTTPISVSLTEAGGSGHSVLVINGTPSGAVGTLTKATDILAVKYDGGGVVGYTTVLGVGAATATISPLYATPGTTTINSTTAAKVVNLTEQGAPGSIAYSATTACADITSTPTSGSGATGTTTINTVAPAGTNLVCTVTLKDVLGTQITENVNFAVYGPITHTVEAFGSGGSGTCGTTLAFNATGETATFTMADPGFLGPYITGNTTPAVASVGVVGSNVTITSLVAGTTTITVGDGNGNTVSCPVSVTTTSGSVI